MNDQSDGAAQVHATGMSHQHDEARGHASSMSNQHDGTPARMSPPIYGRAVTPDAVRWGPDRLVPGIVQDESDGTVLMVGYLDAEALAATLATGLVHFHSRSRGRLWRKGETSGNELRLRDLRLDCDADALLLRVEPTGPTCHTGARSCFDAAGWERPDEAGPEAVRPKAVRPEAEGHPDAQPQGFSWLEELWATIRERAATRPAGSYTARLLDGGVDAVARKVTEEATEVLMAAKDDAVAERDDGPEMAGDRTRVATQDAGAALAADRRLQTRNALAGEMADLLYHLLALAAERDLPPAAVMAVLRARHRR